MNAFMPANILIPQVDSMEKWAVIACDQFTSDPAYWARVAETVGEAPSTLRLILPEAELGTPQEAAHTEETTGPWRPIWPAACSGHTPIPLST